MGGVWIEAHSSGDTHTGISGYPTERFKRPPHQTGDIASAGGIDQTHKHSRSPSSVRERGTQTGAGMHASAVGKMIDGLHGRYSSDTKRSHQDGIFALTFSPISANDCPRGGFNAAGDCTAKFDLPPGYTAWALTTPLAPSQQAKPASSKKEYLVSRAGRGVFQYISKLKKKFQWSCCCRRVNPPL